MREIPRCSKFQLENLAAARAAMNSSLFGLSDEIVSCIVIKLDNKQLILFVAASPRHAALIDRVNCCGKDILRATLTNDGLSTNADLVEDVMARVPFVGIDFLRFKGANTCILWTNSVHLTNVFIFR